MAASGSLGILQKCGKRLLRALQISRLQGFSYRVEILRHFLIQKGPRAGATLPRGILRWETSPQSAERSVSGLRARQIAGPERLRELLDIESPLDEEGLKGGGLKERTT
jgi:hypothetical protein